MTLSPSLGLCPTAAAAAAAALEGRASPMAVEWNPGDIVDDWAFCLLQREVTTEELVSILRLSKHKLLGVMAVFKGLRALSPCLMLVTAKGAVLYRGRGFVSFQ